MGGHGKCWCLCSASAELCSSSPASAFLCSLGSLQQCAREPAGLNLGNEPQRIKAVSKCQCDVTHSLPCAPQSQALHPGLSRWGQGGLESLSWQRREFCGTQESELCLGGCIPGNRLTHCWVKDNAACLLGLAKIPVIGEAWTVPRGCTAAKGERGLSSGSLSLQSTGGRKNQV